VVVADRLISESMVSGQAVTLTGVYELERWCWLTILKSQSGSHRKSSKPPTRRTIGISAFVVVLSNIKREEFGWPQPERWPTSKIEVNPRMEFESGKERKPPRSGKPVFFSQP